MNRVVLAVGRELLYRNALLLPTVHEWFCSFAAEHPYHLKEDIDVTKLVTSANILSNLIASLQHHITYSCKVKKYGTLHYRPNTDLTQNLAHALWHLRQVNMINSSSKYATPTSSPESDDDVSRHIKVLDDINSQACSHINSFITNYR